MSQDGTKVTLMELFVDCDGMMERLVNHMASPLAREVFEQVDTTSMLCLGNAKQDAIETLSAWRAKFSNHHCGAQDPGSPVLGSVYQL